MKKLLVFVLGISLALCTRAQFTKATLQAGGLTCALCSKAINKSLQQLAFVESVSPDLATSAFSIVFKDSAIIDIDGIRKAVEAAGFSVAKLQLTGNFNKVQVKNDSHVDINGKTFHFLQISQQELNGAFQLTVVDKNFLLQKEFKKYAASTKMSCIETGKMENCCKKDGVPGEARIYHVTI